jgi:hypothetical protein
MRRGGSVLIPVRVVLLHQQQPLLDGGSKGKDEQRSRLYQPLSPSLIHETTSTSFPEANCVSSTNAVAAGAELELFMGMQ